MLIVADIDKLHKLKIAPLSIVNHYLVDHVIIVDLVVCLHLLISIASIELMVSGVVPVHRVRATAHVQRPSSVHMMVCKVVVLSKTVGSTVSLVIELIVSSTISIELVPIKLLLLVELELLLLGRWNSKSLAFLDPNGFSK